MLNPLLKNSFLEVQGDVTAHIDWRLFHRSLANLLEKRQFPSNSTVHHALAKRKPLRFKPRRSDMRRAFTPAFERFYRVDTLPSQRINSHHGLGPVRLSVPSPLCTRCSLFVVKRYQYLTDVFAKQPDAIPNRDWISKGRAPDEIVRVGRHLMSCHSEITALADGRNETAENKKGI